MGRRRGSGCPIRRRGGEEGRSGSPLHFFVLHIVFFVVTSKIARVTHVSISNTKILLKTDTNQL
jgi:hypothetical protein